MLGAAGGLGDGAAALPAGGARVAGGRGAEPDAAKELRSGARAASTQRSPSDSLTAAKLKDRMVV